MDKNHIKDLINKPNPIILDIGCYDGGDSIGFANIFPQGKVYSFEADPRSQRLFRGGNFSNIKFCPFALGSINGITKFFVADPGENINHHCSGSLNTPKTHLDFFPDVPFASEGIDVPCRKLDDWYSEEFSKSFFPDIDFIWADVNGGEEQLILGGLETLRTRTRYLYTEFSDHELYSGQINKKRILSLLGNFRIIYEEYGDRGYGNVCLENQHFK